MGWLIYAFLSALFTALTAILAAVILKEKVTPLVLLGAILMSFGAIIIGFSK